MAGRIERIEKDMRELRAEVTGRLDEVTERLDEVTARRKEGSDEIPANPGDDSAGEQSVEDSSAPSGRTGGPRRGRKTDLLKAFQTNASEISGLLRIVEFLRDAGFGLAEMEVDKLGKNSCARVRIKSAESYVVVCTFKFTSQTKWLEVSGQERAKLGKLDDLDKYREELETAARESMPRSGG